MKLAEHVEYIRLLVDAAFRNRLGRMGITETELRPIDSIQSVYYDERNEIETIRETLIAETGNVKDAYEKLVEELTFTLFNRMAALKVMEAHTLHPEIITRRSQHGDRSFAHKFWLEQNPTGRNEEMEGLVKFMEDQFAELTTDIPLFSLKHPYHLMPTAIELNAIINAFNQVETDTNVEDRIWESDDILGWLYEGYQAIARKKLKESGVDIEYDKVRIQACLYTPRWVVKFLVDNSLGKLYLEMYPDSEIRNKYKIANAPKTRIRDPKPLTEIKMIDPATGSGNYILYGFDLFYDLYTDQIENYGEEYDDRKISELIIANNLYGIDLDDRAIQLAQLGLYIKAKRKKRTAKIDHFNVVSSDFYLPPYKDVKSIFEDNSILDTKQKEIIESIWTDLQQAYKFGSLIRLEEKLSIQLHGLTQQFGSPQLSIFNENTLANYDQFRDNFFANLNVAVAQNTVKQGNTFLNTKTQDAITFLQLLTQKYDVAVANPPYTDSADFGTELKTFVETNYKKPYKFNTNLYAVFIKRCWELIDEKGKMAMIHPLTFMYIKTFEDVRKFIIEKTHINVFVEYGNSNLFGSVLVDPAFYVLEKETKSNNSWFISLDQYTRTPNEKLKKDFCLEAIDDYIVSKPNKHNISLSQDKLKIIEGWPFIYWMSDGFREKFKEKSLDDVLYVRQGGATGDNLRTLRLWWEVDNMNLSKVVGDKKKWVVFQKGGPFSKWFGNNWCIIGYNDPIEHKYLKENGNCLPSEDLYLLEGITYSSSGQKGVSFRYMPSNQIISGAGPGVFPNLYTNIHYTLGFLNSKLSFYIADCLNPTVNTTQGDLKRIPFVKPPQLLEDNLAALACENVTIKKQLNSFRVIETNFDQNPILAYADTALKDRLLAYLNYENAQLTQVLINEAIINQLIFEVYELSEEDKQQVEAKMGKSVGELGIGNYELRMFNEAIENEEIQLNPIVLEHLKHLTVIEIDEEKKRQIISEFPALYQSNNDLEEFCIRHQVNPINVWCWFKESKILPQARAAEIALEFLADAFRTILMDDDDGIIPLVGLPDEPKLIDRLEQHCFQQGFTTAQFMQLDSLLGRPVNEYIEQYFFKDLSDHLNLFMYLPKTPFIWHLSSGKHQGFEAYIIIYKWNRDSLYKLKSHYLSKRTENLEYRWQQLIDSTSAQAQTERETIRLQLQEIEAFNKKIDELITEGYDPKLDDGVGKNIAPLQNKGLLKAEVLKSTQLQKYLNADW